MRNTRTLVTLAVCLLTLTGIEASTRTRTHSTPAEVLAVEKSRTTALVHADIQTLDKLLSDDLTYVHASGKVDTKASYLEAIRLGDLHYLSWEPKDLHVRLLSDSALLTGTYHVRAIDQRMQAESSDVHVIVLSVYAKRGGHWQQVAWQSTREPGEQKR